MGTLVVVLLVLLLARRQQQQDGYRTERANQVERAQQAETQAAPNHGGLEDVVRELSGALERAKEENRRGRFLAQLSGALDLNEVLGRTLEAAELLPGMDAAMVVLPNGERGPLIATHGMSREEAANEPVAPPLEGRQPRAVALNYRYGESDVGRDANLIRGGLMVPLTGAREDYVGTLAVFWRGREREPSAEELTTLEELAASAGPMVENARRYLEAREAADHDSMTGLHNRRFFDEALEREVARAHRYGRQLSLMLLDLDDFKEINDRIGHLAGDGVLTQLGARVREALRGTDIACRVGGDELAVILPESGSDDAAQLYERFQRALDARPIAGAERLSASAGVAELIKKDDTARELFQRADEALYRAKEGGKGQVR
ncbi:MAG: diguanylate cyclase [Gaiellaceae bacterium]